jgi:hypothetical protein
MKRGNLPIALYLFLIFISGAVVGALGYRIYKPPATSGSVPQVSPEERRRQYMEEMKTHLGLSPEQMQKLSGISDETRTRNDEVREKHDQVIKQIREDYRAKVRAMLTPEQLPKYEQLRQERELRRKQQEQQNRR